MPARFYTPPAVWNTGTLPDDESHHALKVLRIREGNEIELFDGCGRWATATALPPIGKKLQYEILATYTSPQVAPQIHLYQAISKGKNMDLIIQKAVELGVSAIHPVITQNTVAVSGAPHKKAQKWQRLALEACKQCKQTWLPEVTTPTAFSEIIGEIIEVPEVQIVASLRPGAVPMRDLISEIPPPKTISLWVGPEGDFTPTELDTLESMGCHPVTMGDLVLRVETATLYGISSIRYQFEQARMAI